MAEHRQIVAAVVIPRSARPGMDIGMRRRRRRPRRTTSSVSSPSPLLPRSSSPRNLLLVLLLGLSISWRRDTGISSRNPTSFYYHVSATSPHPQQQQHTSIPRSTNSRHAAHSTSADGTTTTASADASSISDPHRHHPPWNPSKNIDDDGFLVDLYECVPGEWETECAEGGACGAHEDRDGFEHGQNHHQHQHQHPVGGRYADLRKKSRFIFGVTSHHHHATGSKIPSGGNMVTRSEEDATAATKSRTRAGTNKSPEEVHREHDRRSPHLLCRVRQVPGDGNCLFHSVSATLHHALTRQHLSMRNTTLLRNSSADLRRRAVECLSRRKRRALFLQAREYLRAGELVEAAAGQYNISAEEYCELMGKESYWGGGPEIVALCNVLRRPIHVYELSESSPRPPPEEEDEVEGDGAAVGDNNGDHRHRRILGNGRYHRPYHHAHGVSSKAGGRGRKEFRLRRMACFGSPKFDRREPLHILSADSRFPDVTPGRQLPSGNHFLALFPYSPHSPPPRSSV